MADLGLTQFNQIFPMLIRKYDNLIIDQNANERDKINQIINKLNALGKLSNDVVKNWNLVYNWAMNDGLTTDVSNKIETMKTNGELTTILQGIFNSLTGDMTTLHTTAQDTLVNSINEVDDLAKSNQSQLAQNAQQLSGINNVKQYNVVGNGAAGDSSTIQAMINTVRQNVINNGLTSFYTVEIPSGTYVIDQQINMSPYIKLKSNGIVIFKITFSGSAFYVAPQSGDPTYPSTPYHLSKNIWNRGHYFDGANGGFIFTTTLDMTNPSNVPIALEIGSRDNTTSTNLPTSRYTLENVNMFGLDTAIKLNAVNNYIGTFKHCHIEGNNHALWITTPVDPNNYNSGENFVFENCIIAGQKKEAFLSNVPGFDISFEHTSFDFNASPLFRSTHAGQSLRFINCYCEKIGDGVGEQIFYSSEATGAGDANGRNTFYFKNMIMYLKRPMQMFRNLPYSGSYINLYVDIDGLELRYQDTDMTTPYDLTSRFLIDNTQHVFTLRHRILNVSIVKSLVTKDVNLLANSDFEQSTLNADLTTQANDPYWYASYVSNATHPTIVQEGNGGSKCAKYTVNTVGNNSVKYQHNFMYNADASDLIKFDCILKLDKIASTDQIIYRLECYDKNGLLINTLNYYDSTTTASLTTVDNTQFRRNRSFGTFFLPAGTAQIKPYVILNNFSATTVWIDEIHLSKAR